MSELAKAYDPKSVEEKLYRFWEEGGFFKADNQSSKPPFCVVIPPPNVTGSLHMGHALVDTLQDVLVRWKRMCGFETLWVPGTDHAGIATQTVVERHLMKTSGKRRSDFSREDFLALVWEWKETHEANILNQLKRLGCSCDWSRLCFTMDSTRSRAVRVLFKKMFDDKLIYRGDYLVNWDPSTQTALADDEVEHEEKNSFLWHFRYPIEGSEDYLVVATTRPETMLGDTAVAVFPEDERYQSVIGKKVRLPLTNRLIPVIADRFVDPSFGTGAVKITPAHDYNDYEMASRHHLSLINIMTPDGRINEVGGIYAGLTMEEARETIVQKMRQLDLVEQIVPHQHRIGISYRSKAVIQPYLSKQWFVRLSHFKESLLDAVRDKKVMLIPKRWESTYFHWIENLRDWCISRQLWWGHRIPIWYRKDKPDQMICYAGEGVPPEVEKEPGAWVQDEDVLDTWFSSALWPLSVLGWPEATADFKKFYPTSTLITGHDILFFWVARMLCIGEYASGKLPFPETFLHGLIYGRSYWRYGKDGAASYVGGEERKKYDLGHGIPADVHSKWEKMSKSKGNIIDPLEVIDTYGTDAMRMALCSSATQARQIDLDLRRFEEFKNFANKIWNGTRFVCMNLEGLSAEKLEAGINRSLLNLEDKWILSVLSRTIEEVNEHLKNYAFDRAANLAYEFFWKQFCAYYVEFSKPFLFGKAGSPEHKENKQKILFVLLLASIRMIHPMAPFITEELFGILKSYFPHEVACKEDGYIKEALEALKAKACMVAPYPEHLCPQDQDPKIEELFGHLEEILHTIRNIRAEMQLPPGLATDIYFIAKPENAYLRLAKENQPLLQALVRTNKLVFTEREEHFAFSAKGIVGDLKLIIPLPQEMREKEHLRLIKEKERLIAEQNQARTQLSNSAFLERAPAKIVENIKQTLLQSEKQLEEVLKQLSESKG